MNTLHIHTGDAVFDNGFTLLQTLATLGIIGILSSAIVPSFHRHVLNARLNQAEAALMRDSQFMERFYAQRSRFTLNATTWPRLPVQETQHFTITFAGSARGAASNTYRLRADAKNVTEEARYLTIDQNHSVLLCEKRKTKVTCQTR